MSAPLKDESGGKLKSWPGGGCYPAGGGYVPTFRPAEPGERPVATVVESSEKSVYCKYCYEDTTPLTLREEVIPGHVSEMTICAECSCGLTSPEETS